MKPPPVLDAHEPQGAQNVLSYLDRLPTNAVMEKQERIGIVYLNPFYACDPPYTPIGALSYVIATSYSSMH